MTIRIAIIGFGKIARDQHWPSIVENSAFELTAIAGGRAQGPENVERAADHATLLSRFGNKLDAVAICTPPGPRQAIALDCLEAGLDVLLEKPPAATLGALDVLTALAQANKRTLYAGWHSQHAAAVEPARAALAGKSIRTLTIEWREDVRRWHPGQDWVLGSDGFGVLDAGVNALSIASCVLPTPLLIDQARLLTPANRQSPITAELTFAHPNGTAIFDWHAIETDRWMITIETDDGHVVEICDGGLALSIDGRDQDLEARSEYQAMYARFAELIAARESEVDATPLRLVADAFLVATREQVPAFNWV